MNSNEDENLDLIDVELDLSGEVWVPIVGYEGKYELSNYGRVRNSENGRMLALHKHGKKIRVGLRANGVKKDVYIAPLVDECFPTINHFDPSNWDTLNKLRATERRTDMLQNEVWADIRGYEGFYKVSNLGRVRSLDRTIMRTSTRGNSYPQTLKGTMLRIITNPDGYPMVGLSNDIARHRYTVHRLVAEAFIENPSNLPQVNHIDGNKENSHVDNLEWVTRSENMLHAYRTGLASVGEANALAKLTWDDVEYIRSHKDMVYRELATEIGVSIATIHRVATYKSYIEQQMEGKK